MAAIARYARPIMREHQLDPSDLGLTVEEADAVGILDAAIAQRRRIKEQRRAEEMECAKQNRIAPSGKASALDGLPQVSGQHLLSPSKVRERLAITKSELDRWASDGRLPAAGVKRWPGVGPLGGTKTGRAWDPEAVVTAAESIQEWRRQDAVRKQHRRRGLRPV